MVSLWALASSSAADVAGNAILEIEIGTGEEEFV